MPDVITLKQVTEAIECAILAANGRIADNAEFEWWATSDRARGIVFIETTSSNGTRQLYQADIRPVTKWDTSD